MEFYGYEQPQVMQFGSFFNPTSSLMLLSSMLQYGSALREDYKDTMAKLDDFTEKYGSIIGVGADAEGVNLEVRGRINDLYNQLESQGIDPIRSVEGRSRIRNAIRNTDYAYLNAVKQNTEDIRKAQLLMEQAKSDGTWGSDEFLKQAGFILPNSFQTRGLDGKINMYGSHVPVKYRDVSDYADAIFKLLPETDTVYTLNGMPMHVKGRDKDLVEKTVESMLNTYENDPNWIYKINKDADQIQAKTAVDRGEALRLAKDNLRSQLILLGTKKDAPTVDAGYVQKKNEQYQNENLSILRSNSKLNDPSLNNPFKMARESSSHASVYSLNNTKFHKIIPKSRHVTIQEDGTMIIPTGSADGAIERANGGRTHFTKLLLQKGRNGGFSNIYFEQTGQMELINGKYYIYGRAYTIEKQKINTGIKDEKTGEDKFMEVDQFVPKYMTDSLGSDIMYRMEVSEGAGKHIEKQNKPK